MSTGQRFYDQEEVEGILRLASQAQGNPTVSHDQLLQIASEVGLTPEQVAAAERKYATQKLQEEFQAREIELRKQFRQHQGARLIRKALGSLGALALLAFVLPGENRQVVMIVAVAFAISLVKRVINFYSRDTFEAKFQSWRDGKEQDCSGRPISAQSP